MKPIEKISRDTVWEHWRRIEEFDSPDRRSDIREALPTEGDWYRAESAVLQAAVSRIRGQIYFRH